MCRPYVYGSGQYIMKQGHSSMVPLTRGHPPYPASLSSLNGWPYKRGSTLQLRILCPPPPRHSYLGPPVPFRSGVLVTRKLLFLAVVSASQCQASRCITTTALIKKILFINYPPLISVLFCQCLPDSNYFYCVLCSMHANETMQS